jgi:hypothetical protein
MNTHHPYCHARPRGVATLALLLMAACARTPQVATGPHVNFCDQSQPDVTRTGGFDIHPATPYGSDSCPNLFKVRWVSAMNNQANSLPAQAGGEYSAACSDTLMRQIIHRENVDPATGATHFTLVSDKQSGCSGPVPATKKDGGSSYSACLCGKVSAVVEKGATYRVYVGCTVTPNAGSQSQCAFHSWTDEK